MERIRALFDPHGPRRALIIGEVAQAHDGSLGTAHAFIDAVAETGADAVKFQTHIASAESTPSEPWRVRFSPQDERRYDYWRRMEFTEEQWAGLRRHADEKGLLFISSPFSVQAVELLVRVGVPCWKVASGEVGSTDMLDAMARTGLPVLLSSGMSTFAELDEAVAALRARGLSFAALQCTSAYPCPPEKIGLNVLRELRERYGCPVGLSDHSGTPFPSLAACALGCDIVEVHVALSRRMFGPDTASSLTVEELQELVRGIRAIERMLDNPVDKDAQASAMGPMRAIFGKKAVAARDVRAGEPVMRDAVAYKKAAGGIAATEFARYEGWRFVRDVAADTAIVAEDMASGQEQQ